MQACLPLRIIQSSRRLCAWRLAYSRLGKNLFCHFSARQMGFVRAPYEPMLHLLGLSISILWAMLILAGGMRRVSMGGPFLAGIENRNWRWKPFRLGAKRFWRLHRHYCLRPQFWLVFSNQS